jgi:photosystem II stability/assembly factor-like uncharacterized protein
MNMPRTQKPARSKAPRRTAHVVLLVATKKGAWLAHGDSGRKHWRLDGPHFLGHIVHHVVLDPRDRRTLLMTAKTGHLGPTIFRSTNLGKTWKEASKPPAFRKAAEGEKARAVDHVFWLTPAHASEPKAWYAGTSPEGLFRSDDDGDTWQPIAGFNDNPMYGRWTGEGGLGGTPDGSKLHSILIDPRGPAHMYLAMSSNGEGGGVFESTDKGANWKPLNAGSRADFLPNPLPEYGQDPHCVQLHPLAPDILYQQNHCGIYRMERPQGRWERIGDNMPKKVGDIGFPIVLHPRDPNTAWVFPMDGSTVWPRVSVGGMPAAYVTRNAGRSWTRLDNGLPKHSAWLTVLRQAMTADTHQPVGIYFGTTTGQLWASITEGAKWACIVNHLPHIYAVEVAEIG